MTRAQMVESDVSQVWRADEQQTLKDSSHHLVACACSPISPLRKQLLDALRDILRMLAAKYLSVRGRSIRHGRS